MKEEKTFKSVLISTFKNPSPYFIGLVLAIVVIIIIENNRSHDVITKDSRVDVEDSITFKNYVWKSHVATGYHIKNGSRQDSFKIPGYQLIDTTKQGIQFVLVLESHYSGLKDSLKYLNDKINLLQMYVDFQNEDMIYSDDKIDAMADSIKLLKSTIEQLIYKNGYKQSAQSRGY